MKTIFKITACLVLLTLSSCAKNPSAELLVFKAAELSSPNQPIYRFALAYPKGSTTSPQAYHVATLDSAGQEWDGGWVATDPFGNLLTCQDGVWVPFTLGLPHWGPGEALDIWFSQNRHSFHAHIVPYPIKIEQYGYTLYLEKTDPLAHQWRLYGAGFDPQEIVEVIAYIGPKISTFYLAASDCGTFFCDLNAWEEGKCCGATHLELMGAHGTLVFNFPWGNDWFTWRQKEVAERQKQDRQYRHDLIWTSDYQPKF